MLDTCHECLCPMKRVKEDMGIHHSGYDIIIPDVSISRCPRCGSGIISDDEFGRIEDMLSEEEYEQN